MDNMLKLASSPHIHSGKSTSGIMLDVLIALAPALVWAVINFGVRPLLVVLAPRSCELRYLSGAF